MYQPSETKMTEIPEDQGMFEFSDTLQTEPVSVDRPRFFGPTPSVQRLKSAPWSFAPSEEGIVWAKPYVKAGTKVVGPQERSRGVKNRWCHGGVEPGGCGAQNREKP